MSSEPKEFTFDVDADRAAESKRILEGRNFNESMTGDAAGLSTDDPTQNDALRAERENPAAEPDPAEENIYLKRKLGEQAQQTGERFKQLESQLAAMAAARSQPQEQPRQSQGGIPGGVPDFFQDIPDGERYMSASERGRINQLMTMLANATESRLAAVGENAAYVAGKTAAGISDEEETRIATSNPWVHKLSGFDRVQAIKSLSEAARASKEMPGKTAQEAARMAARQQAYVESSSSVTDTQQMDNEPARERLSREVRSGKYRTAKDLEAAMRKLGIGRADSYGRTY